MVRYGAWVCAIAAMGVPLGASASVRLPNVFSDHAVLQRDVAVPVWGTADPGEKVQVQVAGQTKTAVAGQDGRWRARLDPLPPGGPHEMCVSGKNILRRRDLLVGDVWIAAGQSNMGTTMNGSQWWPSECPGADDPEVRLLNMGGNGGYAAAAPQEDVAGAWYPCTPATSLRFSAIGYFFAKQIHREVGVPIGMIKCTSWGAPAEAFIPVETLRQVESLKPLVGRLDADVASYLQKQAGYEKTYGDQLRAYEEQAAQLERRLVEDDRGLKQRWYDPATNVSTWGTLRLPGNWEGTDLKGQGGSVWLRKDVAVEASWAGKDLWLRLGECSDRATVYFNGLEIGRSNAATDALGFRLPAQSVRIGENTIVVRVAVIGPSAGELGSVPPLMCLTPAEPGGRGQRLPLAGDWKYRAGCVWPRGGLAGRPSPRASPAAGNAAPGALYNGMLAPLAGFPIKGVLWYQGESNADRAGQYETLFPLLIRTWRKAWDQDFAFLWVQLPNFLEVRRPKDRTPLPAGLGPDELPLGWAAIREVQSRVLSVPQTGMAVTIDIGQTWEIHPNNKKTVAERLALVALGQVYGKNVAYSGPVYNSMSIEGNQVRLQFRHAAGGLVAKGGPLRHFAIAGEDRRFVWAQVKIAPPVAAGQASDTILVWDDRVKKPVAVRYAFCADPQGANLYNAAGLPASPFRTDNWDLRSP